MARRGPSSETTPSALDRPWARLASLGLFLAAAALLAWLHRDDLVPPEPAVAADDPVQLCLAGRLADIDQMRADGVIGADQAELFAQRAAAFCEDQARAGAGQ